MLTIKIKERIPIYFLVTFLFLIISTHVYADGFYLNCTNTKKTFHTSFKINIKNREIEHVSSRNIETNQKWNLNEPLNVLQLNTSIGITQDITRGNIINFHVFYFNEGTYSHSAHSPSETPHSQLFRCVKDN